MNNREGCDDEAVEVLVLLRRMCDEEHGEDAALRICGFRL